MGDSEWRIRLQGLERHSVGFPPQTNMRAALQMITGLLLRNLNSVTIMGIYSNY